MSALQNGMRTCARATIVADRDVPTKTITGPDGHPIHYPNLPNVGELYRKPDVVGHNAVQQPTVTPAPAPPTATASESWRERVMSAARSALERVGVYGQAAVNAPCATIVLGALLATGCAFGHAGDKVLLPFVGATFYRDTMGTTMVSFAITFPTSPDIVDRPPATAGSRGFAILTPGTSATGLWRLERVVGLVDDQSSRLPILSEKFKASPQHVSVQAFYRSVDQKVSIQVEESSPVSDVHDLLSKYACHELAVNVSVNSDQEAFFNRLVPLTNAPVGPPCVSR